MSIGILVIEDAPESIDFIRTVLADENVRILTASNGEAALMSFSKLHPRIVLASMSLQDMSGLQLMDRMLAQDPGVDFVLMKSDYSPQFAIDSIRRGACDCLAKPLEAQRLRECVLELQREAMVRQQTLQLDHEIADAYQFEAIVGRSPLMLDVFAKIRRVAQHFKSVLVTGETGTGKELVAKAIHRLSPVSTRPFIVCDCSALVETLVESQLFGYVRGAFTGATQDTQGIFESAHGGTVFLDEVGELSLGAQAKLLRVLQNGELQRVGSPVTRKIDVRVIAATHRDLRRMVGQGQFREDLYYRLSTLEIAVPSLAKRAEDLPLLQRHFVKKYSSLYRKEIAGITRRAQVRLAAYPWPGNVRELENVISGASIMCLGHMIDLPELPEFLRSPQSKSDAPEPALSLEEVQQHHVFKVLNLVKNNKARAADILGISRSTLYDILRRSDRARPRSVATSSAEATAFPVN